MSGPSDVPAVVVERAPDGWTHIGGPGMHLLIGLDEEDDRTLAASDAADGGDLDDVIEVLTAGGMRKAHHFVGVHWLPRTRIVAFGPVAALVTLHDGTEHDVRATSSRVWTDVELPEHPERVVLRVLDESERSQPQPAQALAPGSPSQAVSPAQVDETGDAEETEADALDAAPGTDGAAEGPPAPPASRPTSAARVDPARAPSGPAGSMPAPAEPGPPPPAPAASPDLPAPSPAPVEQAVRPQAAPATASPARNSTWDRSWATEQPQPTTAQDTATVGDVPATAGNELLGDAATAAVPAPQLRPWSAVRPPVQGPAPTTPAVRAGAAEAPAPVAAAAPDVPAAPVVPAPRLAEADDLPAAAPTDLESTWASRPVLEAESATAQAPASVPSAGDDPIPSLDPDDTDGDDEQPAAPSYDYLFGHTTAADEHRKVLAQLTGSDDEEEGGDDEVASVPVLAEPTDAAVTNVAPPPAVPEAPIPTVQDLPPVTEGGLISSVPWASTAAAPEVPKPEPEVPTFSGRHTPPPPPSLLPPMNTPPPGVRAPEATPLISTGPPPVSAVTSSPTAAPAPAAPTPAATPAATTATPAAPTGGTAYPGMPRATDEPTFEVPIAPHRPAVPATPETQAHIAAEAPDDDAELTVDRSALLEARNAAQSQNVSGPSVLAVLCSAGHPTPPHGDRCRVCGAGIPPQGPFTMPRPPLGVLRLSTGDVVTLDRSVLLGRAPKLADGVAANDRPHVVKVPSPERDISRNHVEVILEGWHVLIRDLGTTNGTTVTLPGGSPVRLRANDQQVLEPGSFVSMADEVSFTFETAI